MPTWSAPVRYAEVDGQGVVFNAHYLLYCDEAMSAWCRERELLGMAEHVRLVASTLQWKSGAQWGETVSVETTCSRVGTSSFVLDFAITADGRECCQVQTTYVNCDADARPTPVSDEVRAALTATTAQ